MPFSPVVLDRERDKFVENPAGETSVRVYVGNESTDPVNVSGSSIVRSPTGPIAITVGTASDAAANPLVASLIDRVSLSIRNKSGATTIYFHTQVSVTADDAATGGWEIGPGEDLHIDLDDSNNFYLITPAGETAVFKILEIASDVSSVPGGPVAVTSIQETLLGVVNNVNTSFTASQTPSSAAAFVLYLDGLYQPTSNYALVGNAVTMVTPPMFGQQLSAVYTY